jgi:hypothetical protein
VAAAGNWAGSDRASPTVSNYPSLIKRTCATFAASSGIYKYQRSQSVATSTALVVAGLTLGLSADADPATKIQHDQRPVERSRTHR